LRQTFKAFTYPDFRRLWAGAFTSSVGTWMQEVAQNWLILTMTGNVVLLGLDSFLGDSPFLLFSLFGGVFADRFDRRRILLASFALLILVGVALLALALRREPIAKNG